MKRRWAACAVLLLMIAPRGAIAGNEVRVLVAASFRDCLSALADSFTARTGQKFLISSGSTGGLYAQITAGAPCHLFLAADSARPKRLVDDGWAVPADRRVYAVGQLVLCSSRPRPELDGLDCKQVLDLVLRDRRAKLAVANPELAPYGRAARQVLQWSGQPEKYAAQLVTGQDVGQAWQFLYSGAADLGLVALSQVRAAALADPDRRPVQVFALPPASHEPILQEMVLARTAPPEARAFAAYLASAEAAEVLQAFGFLRPEQP